jgi:hypothetical protein|tara:strand:+ start:412 stop:612 length:201 start_codon:yes stop_codon:yes gene_type:complete
LEYFNQLEGLTDAGVPMSVIRVQICREMNWDYWTYQSQPAEFINEILGVMMAEQRHREADKSRRGK